MRNIYSTLALIGIFIKSLKVPHVIYLNFCHPHVWESKKLGGKISGDNFSLKVVQLVLHTKKPSILDFKNVNGHLFWQNTFIGMRIYFQILNFVLKKWYINRFNIHCFIVNGTILSQAVFLITYTHLNIDHYKSASVTEK